MGNVFDVVGAVKPVAQVLLKILELVDPKTRDWVRKRKALEWAEKFFLAYKEVKFLNAKEEKTSKEKRRITYLTRMMRYYEKWFFDYS